MKKEWLIRTKNNHILGPISLKKVKELYDNGSIKSEDEVCAGNGYWFYIREKELVQKYIIGEIPQGFNPVSEAETVLATPQVNEAPQSVEVDGEENVLIPSDDDLAFPEMGDAGEDLVSELRHKTEEIENLESELENLEGEVVNLELSEESDNIVPFTKEDSKPLKKEHIDPIAKKKKKVSELKESRQKPSAGVLSQNTLYFLAILLFILALLGFYYRKKLIKGLIEANIGVYSNAYAQVIPNAVKKK